MSCDHLREELSGLLDGALEASAARSLRAHVETCVACRAELEALGQLSALLAVNLEPDPGFIVRFRERRDQAIRGTLVSLSWRRLALRLVPLAAAAVLGVTTGIWLSTPAEQVATSVAWSELEQRAWGSDQALAAEELVARPVLHIAMEPFPGGLP